VSERSAEVRAAKALAVDLLDDTLDKLRGLTHRGWQLAHAAAIKDGDLDLASRCSMAQKLAAFKGPSDHFEGTL
jgi:hypothetical protein